MTRAARTLILLAMGLVPVACTDSLLPTDAGSPGLDLMPMAYVIEVENTSDAGPGSLRDAISTAQNGHVITFAPHLAGETIELSFELFIGRSLTIQAPPEGITLRATNGARALAVGVDVHEVVLENLIIEGARYTGSFGGGLINGGNLTLRNSTIRDNWAAFAGAGIYNFGTLTLIGSTVSGNGFVEDLGATSYGGGIHNRGTLLLVNSTVSGNTAAIDGGGINNFEGHVTLLHATVADNGASRGGGLASNGSFAIPASMTLYNSVVAANASGAAANGPDVYLYIIEPYNAVIAGHSLIGTTAGYAIADDQGGNLIGVNPGFVLDGFGKALLADNGGPTQTHTFAGASPAIGAADLDHCTAALVAGVDQRGIARPQGTGCDMGAVEVQSAAPPPVAVIAAFSLDSQGSVDRMSGAASVHGSISCTSPGPVQLEVRLTQEQKNRGITTVVSATGVVIIECDGTMAWSAGMTAVNGVFTNGKAEAMATILDPAGPAAGPMSVQLFWNR
ncbi:MAG TPA: choice-of-anchor Q domain-containing protein [Longimicrobiales bacterium]|nr:choice-of-anchor Q domain-containing protein [Longimicrobiales bacterium]